MEIPADYLETNRQLWNARTRVHARSDFYDVDGFKAGKSTLNPLELQELSPVAGKTLLHLQCHFGLDTLSWAREGATVTGIDLSDEAIALAQSLAEELKLDARFICSDVYSLKDNLQGQFDIVFTSYGCICWLPDVQKWADIVAHFLKPGGTFYIADFHPVLMMFDNEFTRFQYPYFNTEAIIETTPGTYADTEAPIAQKEISWNHPFSEVISALAGVGLRIEYLHELPYSYYNCFRNMVQGPDGYWRFKGMEDLVPVTYSIKAVKPE